MNISIIYEDEDILVIDKPAGMTVNRAETTRYGETVQDWAEEKMGINPKLCFPHAGGFQPRAHEGRKFGAGKGELWDPVAEFYNRGGVVHRLDKETSGVLILAKNPDAFAAVQKQFKERVVKKAYTALAHGKIVPKEGEVSIPVGRLSWNRMQFGIVPGGRESVTFYKVKAYYQDSERKEYYSYVELSPKTGRTHQIRVHLKYLGHPIFADFLYAGRKTAKKDRKILNRVFLHAAKISFVHPKSGEEVHFESPLPAELDLVIKQLKPVE